MAKRRVFQVIECGGPGGAGQQVAALCNGLDRERFETTLVYAVRPGAEPQAYRKTASGAARAIHVPELVREITPAKDLAALEALTALFREDKPDVVHAHCSKAGVLARLAAWRARVPKVFYSPRGYGFLMQDRSKASRLLYAGLERAVSWIGEIVAVSPAEAELARGLNWGRPVHVAPDPYLGTFHPPRPADGEKDGLLVGACGRLTYARCPEAFVKLSQRLTDSRNGLRCLWIGDGELGGTVREMLRDMNLAGRLEITGWLEPEEARRRLEGLDVFVHFSRWEGLPNAVLEAMAAGLPVVASDIPGNRDAVVHERTGLLAKTEIELLEHTLRLVDDPALRERLGGAGRRRVEAEFQLRRTLRILEDLYSR